MSSRAKKKKNKSTPRDPGHVGEDGAEPSKSEAGWFEMGVGAVALFGVAFGLGLEVFGSWKVSVACGGAAALLSFVLVRRGVRMF